jgi:hypothetical protein
VAASSLRVGLVSGLEPVDGTWFETGDGPPLDVPLILLVPIRQNRAH